MKSQQVISPLSGFVVPLLYLFRQKMFKSILKIILKLLYKFTCFTGRQKYFTLAVCIYVSLQYMYAVAHDLFVISNLQTVFLHPVFSIFFYYMPSSASRQDEPNLALWLATLAGKMELSCLLRIRVMSRKEFYHVMVFYPI